MAKSKTQVAADELALSSVFLTERERLILETFERALASGEPKQPRGPKKPR